MPRSLVLADIRFIQLPSPSHANKLHFYFVQKIWVAGPFWVRLFHKHFVLSASVSVTVLKSPVERALQSLVIASH